MTAKIKLNAASGGGSISIQAPSSSSNNRVIALPDIADGTLLTSQSTLDSTKLSPAVADTNDFVKLSTTTVSSPVGSLTFNNSITGAFDTYKTYAVSIALLRPVTDDVTFQMRLQDSNGTYQASEYKTVIHAFSDGDHGYGAQTRWQLIRHGIGNNTSGSIIYEDAQMLYYFSGFEANRRLKVRGQAVYQSNNSDTQVVDMGGTVNNHNAVTGLVFFMSSGNIASGVFTLYGLKS
jgi:hypothetical protein|tara:strand:- start:322 stop:1026 length:705 start_codon:yes stop_codon:yes gene_type:complete